MFLYNPCGFAYCKKLSCRKCEYFSPVLSIFHKEIEIKGLLRLYVRYFW